MKKCTLYFLFALLAFASCRKSDVQSEEQTTSVSKQKKVNELLLGNKRDIDPALNTSIDQILGALDHSRLHKEEYSNTEDIWVIPLKSDYKAIGESSDKGYFNLVLFASKNGDIRVGRLVKYVPHETSVELVPTNTFHDYYAFSSKLNARFEFYNLWGKKFQVSDYKNGELVSFGTTKRKNATSRTNTPPPDEECTEWTLATDWYIDGVYWKTTYESLGITCYPTAASWYSTIQPAAGGGGAVVYDQDSDTRSVSAMPSWTLEMSGRGGNWTMYLSTGFKGIKDLVDPTNNYFYNATPGAATTMQNPNPDNYYWDGYEEAELVNPLLGQAKLIGQVVLPLPWQTWLVGTTSSPYIKTFTFDQVFP